LHFVCLAAPSEIQFAWYPAWDGDKNVIFYLQQMQQYEKQHGQRILDTYDIHYPNSISRWPKLTDVEHIRELVDKYYPGTKISFSEWSLAGTGPLGGALAFADNLGHFAKNQIAWASIWGINFGDLHGPVSYAYRVLRNYDGHGNGFGDNYISSSSTGDDAALSVHAAIRNSDGALTILVINKIAGDQTSTLTLKGFNPKSPAQVFQFSAGNEQAIVSKPSINVAGSGFTYSYAAFSLTMVEIPHA